MHHSLSPAEIYPLLARNCFLCKIRLAALSELCGLAFQQWYWLHM